MATINKQCYGCKYMTVDTDGSTRCNDIKQDELNYCKDGSMFERPMTLKQREQNKQSASACPKCGGWTNMGGMSQYYNTPDGCTCHKSKPMTANKPTVLQDVTITIDISNVTPEQYQQTMKRLNRLSLGEVNTHTYYEGKNEADVTMLEQAELKAHVIMLQGKPKQELMTIICKMRDNRMFLSSEKTGDHSITRTDETDREWSDRVNAHYNGFIQNQGETVLVSFE